LGGIGGRVCVLEEDEDWNDEVALGDTPASGVSIFMSLSSCCFARAQRRLD
jgi:hypothetical protein